MKKYYFFNLNLAQSQIHQLDVNGVLSEELLECFRELVSLATTEYVYGTGFCLLKTFSISAFDKKYDSQLKEFLFCCCSRVKCIEHLDTITNITFG